MLPRFLLSPSLSRPRSFLAPATQHRTSSSYIAQRRRLLDKSDFVSLLASSSPPLDSRSSRSLYYCKLECVFAPLFQVSIFDVLPLIRKAPPIDYDAKLLKFPDERLGTHYDLNYRSFSFPRNQFFVHFRLLGYGVTSLGENAYHNLHMRHLAMRAVGSAGSSIFHSNFPHDCRQTKVYSCTYRAQKVSH